jgi:hypothetical protein
MEVEILKIFHFEQRLKLSMHSRNEKTQVSRLVLPRHKFEWSAKNSFAVFHIIAGKENYESF